MPSRHPAGRCAVAALFATGLSACGAARAPMVVPTTSSAFFVAGYHPYWAGQDWSGYPDGVLDELYFFEIEAAADGSFLDAHGWPDEWSGLVDDARLRGLQLTPTISMHDGDAFMTLFQDGIAIDRLVGEIESMLTVTPGLAGIHLDFEVFEPVPLPARDGYTAFVGRLAERMDARFPELALSVFVLAFDDDDAYNEVALAALADYVVVQGYDFHSIGSERAGPVAGAAGWGRLNWSHVIDRFLDFGVPPRKIVMSVPLYGYQWPVVSDERGARTRGPAVAIPYAPGDAVLPELPRARVQAEVHGLLRDGDSGSPYYVFRGDDGWYQGWFDDPASLRRKFEIVRERGLGGVAIFPAAYADDEVWDELRRAFSDPRF